jgi:hypothetical protein
MARLLLPGKAEPAILDHPLTRASPTGVQLGDLAKQPPSAVIVQGGAVNEKRPIEITDEMRQATDNARRQGLQKDLRTLAEQIQADAKDRYANERAGWQAGVEWSLL